MYDDRIAQGFTPSSTGKAPWKTALIGKIMACLAGKMTPKEAALKRDALAKKFDYDACDHVGSLYDSSYLREIVPKEVFGAGTNLPFEDLTIRVPAQPEVYLTHMYGDYQQLPPEAERVPQHDCQVIDPHTSYEEYL